MLTIWKIIYNLFLPFIYIIFNILRLFNEKIDKTIKARKYLFRNLSKQVYKIEKNKQTIWIHSPSMGEFEQAKPLIEKLYKVGNYNIIVSFFSPSGYENQKNYTLAHIITYIPFDFYWQIKKFVSIISPDYAIFTRYDIWPNTLWQLKKKSIKTYLIDATLKDKSLRLLPIVRNFHKYLFNNFDKIFAISEIDKNNLLKFGLNQRIIEVVGDTRYDRVYIKSKEQVDKHLLKEQIVKSKRIIVFGSSWHDDQKNYLDSLLKLHHEDNDLLSIIVPHEPTDEHIIEITEKLNIPHILYSKIEKYKNEKIIIVDCIGILLTLYKYAKLAFVGGSFKQGIHNVLEPAVYGIPVVFGPKIDNSQEAKLLVKEGIGYIFDNNENFYILVKDLLYDDQKLNIIKNKATKLFEKNIGATEAIFSKLKK